MIVWNAESTEYGDYSGILTGTGFHVTVECSNGRWRFFVWGPTGTAYFRSPRPYLTADEAKAAAEALAE